MYKKLEDITSKYNPGEPGKDNRAWEKTKNIWRKTPKPLKYVAVGAGVGILPGVTVVGGAIGGAIVYGGKKGIEYLLKKYSSKKD